MPALSVPQAFQLAHQHHQAGRLAEAEALYRQILAAEPGHADALHLLGVVAHQFGRHAAAVDLITKAITAAPGVPAFHSNLGEAYRALGHIDEAIAAYRQAITLRVNYPDAHSNLGNALREKGQLDEAIASCRQAIALRPDYPEAYGNLGNALMEQGQWEEAVAAYRRAITLDPDLPGVHYNLGNALRDKGQLEEAIASYRQTIALRPNHPKACNNLGNALHDKRQWGEAIAAYRQAITLQPNFPDAYNNLGNTLHDKGQLDEAIAAYRQAIALQPNFPDAYYNLGIALYGKALLDEAITSYRQAIALRPHYPEAYSNLGNALTDQGQLDEAIAAYRQAIALKPNYPEAHSNLGAALQGKGQLEEAIAVHRQTIALKTDFSEAHRNLASALMDQGQLDEAIAACRQALALKADSSQAHSGLIFTLHYHPGHDAETIGEEQRLWSQQHAAALKQFIEPHANDPNPTRRLRIGYVSPDLRDHVLVRYMMPLFEYHDRAQFELICYSGVRRPDERTARFLSLANRWRSTVGLGDQQVAELIRKDGVDILVDLSQHMAGNRLLVFARRPAPVQVSYGGYPGSTGLEAIEYRISDRWLESESGIDAGRTSQDIPQEMQVAGCRLQDDSERNFHPASCILHPASAFSPSERVFLLDSFWCYDPRGMEVAVNELPAREKGQVTFGCLNNFCKVNDRVLALWARVLGRVEGSRLLLLSPAGSHREPTLAMLRQLGVEGSRVEFVAPRPRCEYLEWYHRIDIVLETFPYNGHTTSLDAFWMGVPVPALVGALPVGRAGLSHLMNLGLPELVARSEEEYVNRVVELAGDLPRLAELRATLRERMKASVLMDAPRYARNIEAAYHAMWRQWCQKRG